MAAMITRVLLFESANVSYFGSLTSDAKFYFVEDVLRLLAGVALVAGSARIAQWLISSRGDTLSKTAADAPPPS